jgi:hypothetical protein
MIKSDAPIRTRERGSPNDFLKAPLASTSNLETRLKVNVDEAHDLKARKFSGAARSEGCVRGRRLFQEIKARGYTGSFSNLERLLAKLAKSEMQEGDGYIGCSESAA